MIKKLIPLLGLILISGIFFWQFLFKGLLPISSDTIIGLYHPYRDLYANEYPNGIPYKNFLITDPVRQQYPWKKLSVEILKDKKLPSWNPYSFSGTPLLGNFQAGVFYPLNLFFFILPFNLSWSILIILQPFLAGIFMFAYLKNLKLDNFSSFLGGVVFSFSGFFSTWLEWGTILHTALWLPLILLSIDKITFYVNSKQKISKYFTWSVILIFATISSFFAGHLQTFFYLSLVSAVYILIRLWQTRSVRLGSLFLITWFVTLLLTSIQLIPTFEFILQSARDSDQLWQKEGWFLPWQHLIQLIAPDFFGNPSTLNYWGRWNYGELTAYAGIIPLILAIVAIFYRRDKKTIYSGLLLLASLLFALSNPISKLPFLFNIPLLSTAQPTRLIFLVDFSLAVLAALGLSYFLKSKKIKELVLPIGIVGLIIFSLYIFALTGSKFGAEQENLIVAKRNLILPSVLFASALILFLLPKLRASYKVIGILLLIIITTFDLLRFSWKFNTFSEKKYLFPSTSSISFIKENLGNYRIATTDPRILPPNFSSIYKIQSVEGYDPLFTQMYAEFISALNRNEPNIDPPFGFNRIVRIENFSNNLVDLMGVKYVLSFSNLDNPKYDLVFQEGQTKIFENTKAYPRAFFVDRISHASSRKETIDKLFEISEKYSSEAVVEGDIGSKSFAKGEIKVLKYSPNEIILQTKNSREGFLVLTDAFYSTWRVKIDDKPTMIYRTNYIFRGIVVPGGNHNITFYNSIL